jgi:hypothetical protein
MLGTPGALGVAVPRLHVDRRSLMPPRMKFRSVLAAAIGIAAGSMASSSASAVTVEVAKKCETLMALAFPPRIPGNPAAGSDKGTGADQQKYYDQCVANGGNTGGNSGDKTGGDANTPGK